MYDSGLITNPHPSTKTMRTKLVKRHYCSYCGKGGFQIPAMNNHESSCTLNPKRNCRVCKAEPRNYPALISEIRTDMRCKLVENTCKDETIWNVEDESLIRDLSSMVDGCPACTLAVIRQGKLNCSWDYREAFKAYQEAEQDMHATYG